MLTFVFRFFILILLSSFFEVRAADGMEEARANVVKAGMISGFATYTTWPVSDSDGPFIIGVLGGDDYFIAAMERFFKKKPIGNGRVILIRAIELEQVTDCQIVVLLGTANRQATQILARIAKLPILTISDSEDFTSFGGHVNFFNQNNKLRFEINWKSTTESRLKISSRLLRLAKVVGERP